MIFRLESLGQRFVLVGCRVAEFRQENEVFVFKNLFERLLARSH
jgi:hypothetical protein